MRSKDDFHRFRQMKYVSVTYKGEKKSEVCAERPASSTCSHRDPKGTRPQESRPAVLYYPNRDRSFRWIGHEFRSRGTTRLAIMRQPLTQGHGPFYSYSICIKGIDLRRTRSTSGRGSGKPPDETFRRIETATRPLYEPLYAQSNCVLP